jgi:hypothetical protein
MPLFVRRRSTTGATSAAECAATVAAAKRGGCGAHGVFGAWAAATDAFGGRWPRARGGASPCATAQCALSWPRSRGGRSIPRRFVASFRPRRLGTLVNLTRALLRELRKM